MTRFVNVVIKVFKEATVVANVQASTEEYEKVNAVSAIFPEPPDKTSK